MRAAYLLAQLREVREQATGCSLCWLEHRQVHSYLQGVANDGVNDPPLRRKLARQGGYCPAHSAAFVTLASPLPAAILLDAFLHDRLEAVRAGRRPRRLRCEACAVRDMTGARFVKAISRHGASGALGAELRLARWCLPHLCRFAPALPSGLRDALAARHDGLRHDLQEVIRKHDYRYAREAFSEDERASLRRALESLGSLP